MINKEFRFIDIFEGSDLFYLADPNNITVKKNGGERWGVKKEFKLPLSYCLEGHLNGTLNKGVVLPPIRKSDNKCKWGAIDVDGEVYKDEKLKKELLSRSRKLNLPLVPCFSKSKGLHLYIKFTDWTDAQKVIDVLHTLLFKLNLPQNTECFPKQAKVLDTGNGIMLPFMNGIGNDYIKDFNDDGFITGSQQEFLNALIENKVNADNFEIKLPEQSQPKKEKKKDWLSNINDDGQTKISILMAIKNGTIEEHPDMGGKYHSWIQVVIAKAVAQGYGDNEILQLIKEVHEDGRGIGYVWPESYQKQINYTRQENRLNIPNPGDTKILKGKNLEQGFTLERILKSYCYVMANDMFNKLGSSEFYQDRQINNFHKHEVFLDKGTLTGNLLANKKFARAETFITSAKYKPGLIHIDRPGIIPLVSKGTVLNIYVPHYLEPKKGDIQFIIDFYVWLLGRDKWNMIEKWIAFNIQNPGVKMKWAVVLVSEIEGAGKGLLARIISRILGFENVNENANYKHLTNTHNTLLIGTQVLVLNEVSLGDFKSKAEGSNSLKNFVADDFYSCNFKNKPMVKLPNLTNFLLFSNDPRVLSLNNGARRYYFCNIKKTEEELIQKEEDGTFEKIWDFVDSDDGASALIHFFKNEVKINNPKIFLGRAPQTDDLKELIEQSKHPVIKKLEYDLTRPDINHRRIFNGNWSGLATFNWLNDQLSTKTLKHEITGDRETFDWGSYGDDAIYKFLSSNSIPWNNGDKTKQIEINGVRQRLYILDDSMCPIPGKSYKDLTPKQIETIHLNYNKVERTIAEEKPEYLKALDREPGQVEEVKDKIKQTIELSKTMRSHSKNGALSKFKGWDPEELFNDVVSGKEELAHNDQFLVKALLKYRKTISRGIRTPEKIIEDIRNNEE